MCNFFWIKKLSDLMMMIIMMILIIIARSRNKKRRVGEENMKETVCPICSERLTGTPEELNGHVEVCLKKVGTKELFFQLQLSSV